MASALVCAQQELHLTSCECAGLQPPQSCATLDLDSLARRVARKGMPQQEVDLVQRQLGLRMAAISTFLG